ncbi:MAG TPA: cobyric acid synthase, partial [Thermoleophilia bacterium]|nr:cobyric acid synthase [Thermoleophilia bacterium]
ADPAQSRPGARAVMCVGTGSHAGKSVLAAALCRIYARRGYRVAPFKAQNMALNSYVTPEGGELGRAQAYQARAAGVEPHVDMNPVLLKPSSQTGSQVIVLGRPVRRMAVREYHAYQPEVWPTVTAAFDRLRAENDLIVMEGAGSPAEINLRGQDIVNMRMALYAQSPTLLIGDIDRGGVFASLVGHMELFTPEERRLIAAFVINKFRGDATLLDSGIEFLRERTGVPTLGVVPMLSDWRGDEEDSLGIEDRRRRAKPEAPLQIAVVRLPFISNYTDFDALADEPDVNVRYITTPGELEGIAAIVLPGTKSTIADLAWLRRTGLADAVTQHTTAGTPVVGVCGGYQMLGRRIHDPERVEADVYAVDGLGLLDVETTFAGDKRTVRVEGELLAGAAVLGAPGTPLHGYEIHMGRTTLGRNAAPLLRLRGADGLLHEDGAAAGTVCGSYVHGLFDRPELRATFLNRLRAKAGLPQSESIAASPDDDIERLADHVEAYLDADLLERIVGLEER